MQTVTIEGYLAADPSILAAQGSGKKRASFRVLETARFRRAGDRRGERTTGFNCVCFNEAMAENYVGPFARKGSRVVAQGHVENDTWTGRDGTVHFDLRLVVDELRLKNRREEDAAPEGGTGDAQARAFDPDFDDEIPF